MKSASVLSVLFAKIENFNYFHASHPSHENVINNENKFLRKEIKISYIKSASYRKIISSILHLNSCAMAAFKFNFALIFLVIACNQVLSQERLNWVLDFSQSMAQRGIKVLDNQLAKTQATAPAPPAAPAPAPAPPAPPARPKPGCSPAPPPRNEKELLAYLKSIYEASQRPQRKTSFIMPIPPDHPVQPILPLPPSISFPPVHPSPPCKSCQPEKFRIVVVDDCHDKSSESSSSESNEVIVVPRDHKGSFHYKLKH
jgi:hypothetical protein